jgi:hypothetical protein
VGAGDLDLNQIAFRILKLVETKPKLVYILIQYRTDGDNRMVLIDAFSAVAPYAKEARQAL